MSCITITFGDCSENHVGMEKICKISNLDEILKLKDQLKIVGVLSVGYPKSNSKKTRKDFKTITTWL